MPSFALKSHPSCSCRALGRIEASAEIGHGCLVLEYRLEGEIEALSLPEPGLPRRTDGLWRETCFEAFIKPAPDSPGYLEYNFSPSSAWAAYRFDSYRQGMADHGETPPEISLQSSPRKLVLKVKVRLEGLPAEAREIALGLSAVIKEKSGSISYWAYRHPEGKPDFHHPDGFAIRLNR